MGWKQSPLSVRNLRWEGIEGPETADPTELHYLMQPYHALQIALLNEKRARDFFFARLGERDDQRRACAKARWRWKDEAEHVRLIEEWLKRTPKPGRQIGKRDPDPPVLSD